MVSTFNELAQKEGLNGTSTKRPVACVQGLGFVGTAMAIAVGYSKNGVGDPLFNVIGVDLPTAHGIQRVEEINNGVLPLKANDAFLKKAFRDTLRTGNFIATTNSEAFTLADYIIVNVGLDLNFEEDEPKVDYAPFVNAIQTIGRYCKETALVIIETTVPPGTCEKIVVPALQKDFKKRNLNEKKLLVAHSYERVMPGDNYLNSVINFWRVYAGTTEKAADLCEEFLSKVINTNDYPLTSLHSTTASEIAKILENAYRATNIAFINEWGHFAESVGVDLFEVINAIKVRPTHSNIRHPGFGVGGYCLTKDALFGLFSARNLFNLNLDFPFSKLAITTNNKMPIKTLEKLLDIFENNLSDKKILLMGVSYRQDVGDTRNSPSEVFARAVIEKGGLIDYHDPYVDFWPEMSVTINAELPNPSAYDAIVLAIPHKEYLNIDYTYWFKDAINTAILDANDVLTKVQRKELRQLGNQIVSIGRGVIHE